MGVGLRKCLTPTPYARSSAYYILTSNHATFIHMFEVIPAIDILQGKCVRLTRGNYKDVTTYNDSPIAVAQNWQKLGFNRLHLVDLDGAKTGEPVNMAVISELAKIPGLTLDIGGGIRTLKTIETYLDAGISYVILGSVIFKDPKLLDQAIKEFGNKIIAGVDMDNGEFKISGWLESTALKGINVLKDLGSRGVRTVIVTDISKDGMLKGPNFSLYQSLAGLKDLRIIASGGVTSIEDVQKLSTLKNISGCIVGKALYDGVLDPKRLRELF